MSGHRPVVRVLDSVTGDWGRVTGSCPCGWYAWELWTRQAQDRSVSVDLVRFWAWRHAKGDG